VRATKREGHRENGRDEGREVKATEILTDNNSELLNEIVLDQLCPKSELWSWVRIATRQTEFCPVRPLICSVPT
jgi:hypothetical protein